MKSRVVFLDRDGTIARDVHYCRRVEDLEILPTIPEGIRLLNERGFKVIVVTNQSGVARGYFTEETLAQIHEKMRDELAQHGAWVDAIYYCPHHPDEGCDCRKPKPGLIHRAAKEHNIELSQSFFIGDQLQDVEAGRSASCRTVLISSPVPFQMPQDPNNVVKPDFIAHDFLEAYKWVVGTSGQPDVKDFYTEAKRVKKTGTILKDS